MISSFGQYGGAGQAIRKSSGPAMYDRVRNKSRIDSTKLGSTKQSVSSSTEILKYSTLEIYKNNENKVKCKNCLDGGIRSDECPACGNQMLTINVSGLKFVTHASFIENRHPNTLLGNLEKRAPYYNAFRNEIFLDRHRPSFEVIFCYLREGGKLRRPAHIPDFIFYEEIIFYELDEKSIAEYLRSEGNCEDDVITTDKHSNRCHAWNPFKSKVWALFELPESSKRAKFIGIFSIFITVVSIAAFIIETVPAMRDVIRDRCHSDEVANPIRPFFLIEAICSTWFTLELLVRFITCPSKLQFVRGFSNWVDFLSVLPFYMGLIAHAMQLGCHGDAKKAGWMALLRILRISRVFKLTKHSIGLQVLMDTFRASVEGLMIFVMTLLFSTIVYSSLLYYIEMDTPDSQVESIPHGFWWAVITMTTVGYGDQVPVSTLGKIVGVCCAVTGVLTLAIPIPIITNNFNKFYSFRTGKGVR